MKEVRSLAQVLDGQLEEETLSGLSFANLFLYGRVVVGALADGVVEDGGIRGQSGDGELVDVFPQRPLRQKGAGDVVEPDALTEVVEKLRRIHGVTSRPPRGGRVRD